MPIYENEIKNYKRKKNTTAMKPGSGKEENS